VTGQEADAALARLREMLYWNTWETLGQAAATRTRRRGDTAARRWQEGTPPLSYGDGRLAPHEWLRTRSGRLLKADGVGHDADHTVVGRQALAWDLAGAMVEWGLDEAAAGPLLHAVREAEALPPAATLTFYCMAYAAFRVGQTSLCAGMLAHDPDEQARLWRAHAVYRDALTRLLDSEE
jgi:hypothetical protein